MLIFLPLIQRLEWGLGRGKGSHGCKVPAAHMISQAILQRPVYTQGRAQTLRPHPSHPTHESLSSVDLPSASFGPPLLGPIILASLSLPLWKFRSHVSSH